VTRRQLHCALVGVLASEEPNRGRFGYTASPMAGCPGCGGLETAGLGLLGDDGEAWPWCFACGLQGEAWTEAARAAVERAGGRWPTWTGPTVRDHVALRGDLDAFWSATSAVGRTR
jgi:hypothetical protein